MATTTLTNATISETYVSLLHSNGEILPATGQVVIYDGCGNESSIKIGRCLDNAGLTVCGPISASGALDGDWSTLINLIYPVGSVFFSADNVNPGVRFTGTTWTQTASGRFIAGVGTGTDINTNTHAVAAGEDSSTGEYTHQLTINEMPSHNHNMKAYGNGTGGVGGGYLGVADTTLLFSQGRPSIDLEGGNQYHNNIPPYFGLYVWQRTA